MRKCTCLNWKQPGLILVSVLSLIAHLSIPVHSLTVSADFNQRGVRGTITFSQDDPQNSTIISVNITGLDTAAGGPFLWHVHQYPFPHNGFTSSDVCSVAVTGGHYDPLGASDVVNYSTVCNRNSTQSCEIGDLSGKFGPLSADTLITYTDPSLSLYGVYSIIGRSIVVHFNDSSRFICANIGYPDQDQTNILYVPFRRDFTGSIYFRQHSTGSTASVYTDLFRVMDDEDSMGHNWHVHQSPINSAGDDCMIAGPHYNPRKVNTSAESDYSERCGANSTSFQQNCEIGDLSNKGAPFDVENRVTKQYYTDTDLPLVGGDISIASRSVVIHDANRTGERIACSNISVYQPLEAVANFDENGISGSIQFFQQSPFDPTQVRVNLEGLSGNTDGYHVHVTPVGPDFVGSPTKCLGEYTGGHWNPINVNYTMVPPVTSDQYEVGDLSGKFGGLSGLDQISEVYFDQNVPLFGPYNIIGRSIVIHRPSGDRLICSNIEHVRPVIQVVTLVNTTGFSGQIRFIQPADDPNAETTIVIELEIYDGLAPAVVTPSVTMTTSMITSSSIASLSVAATMSSSVAATLSSSVQPQSSSVVLAQPRPSVASSQTVLQPSSTESGGLLPTPSPMPTPMGGSASGPMTDSGSDGPIMPLSTLPEMPTETPMSNMRRRKRRRTSGAVKRSRRVRRQTLGSPVLFDWSVRVSSVADSADCSSLPLLDEVSNVDSSLCTSSNHLACSAGDLSAKHGRLSLPQQPGTRFRAVFTDSNLPLSGPNAAYADTASQSPLLFLQPVAGATGPVVCEQTIVIPPPPTEAPPTNTPTNTPTDGPSPTTVTPAETTQPPQAQDNTAVVGGVVGGIFGAVLLVVIVILLVVLLVWCVRERSKSTYELSKMSHIEMGTVRPSKPLLGVPTYKALHNYAPQNDDDLELVRGEWVTLIETPYGGGWWKGSVEGRVEGWFPKTYVEYVDIEAEKKKVQEENFKLAAVAIVAASSSFSARHPSLTRHKRHDTTAAKKPKRAATFNKNQIDSTPKMVTKFDKPYLADYNEDEPPEVVVIENTARDTSRGGSCPATPSSQRNVEIIPNQAALEGGSSQESNQDTSMVENQAYGVLAAATAAQGQSSEYDYPQTVAAATEDLANLLQSEQYIAKYPFGGGTDIELEFVKGNIINVFEKADNGWWKGLCEGRVGWFPESYVRQAPVQSPPPKTEVTAAAQVEQPRKMDEMMASGDDFEASEYRAVFSYQSDMEGDLIFNENDTVLVYWADENGWWFGAAGNAQGWFPGCYVEPIIDVSEAGSAAASPIHPIQEEALEEDEGGENEGGLAGELAAFMKKKKARKQEGEAEKDTRGSFKKRWSLKRKSREKKKESTSSEQSQAVVQAEATQASTQQETQQQNDVQRPVTNSGGEALQGELAAALSTRQSNEQATVAQIEEVRKENVSTENAAVENVTTVQSQEQATPSEQLVTQTPDSAQTQQQQQSPYNNLKGRRRAPPPPGANKGSTAAQPPAPVKAPKQPVSKPSQETKTSPLPITTSTPKSSRSHSTLTDPRNINSQPAARPQRPRQRRTTAAGVHMKGIPKRRPPPLPPQSLAARGRAKPTPGKAVEETDGVSVEAVPPPKKVKARPSQAPVAPPRPNFKPRVQKVKRPVSRMIPPPPNIPLPPPPARKNDVSETAAAPTQTAGKDETDSVAAVEGTTSPSSPKPPTLPKPAVLPKPVLSPKSSALRRATEPSSSRSDSPTQTQKKFSKGPRPPPPSRTSSLSASSSPAPVAAKRKQPPAAQLSGVKEEPEYAPLVTKSELNIKATKSAPPKRPPPPRPVSVASNHTAIESKPENPISKPARPDRPPTRKSSGGNMKPGSEEVDGEASPGHPVKSRGSGIMRSLKKMVRGDSKKESEKEKPQSAPARPSQPPKRPGEPPKNKPSTEVNSQEAQPVPKTRPKTPNTPTEMTKPSETSQTEAAKTKLPERPPPPLVKETQNSGQTNTSTSALSRPPPPKVVSNGNPQSPETETIQAVPKPSPAPRKDVQTDIVQKSNGSVGQTSAPVAKPRSNVTSSPVQDSTRDSSSAGGSTSPNIPTSFYRALKSYQAENSEEISFSKGDTIMIVEQRDGGFNYGMLDDGTSGLFPVSHVEPFFSK